MSIAERLKSLEEKIAHIFHTQEKAQDPPHTLVLKSPNGKYSITLLCTDEGAGVWLTGSKTTDSTVSIYNGFHQGPVVGLFGDRHGETSRVGLDVAMGTDPDNGSGYLMLIDKDKNVSFLKPEDLGPLP